MIKFALTIAVATMSLSIYANDIDAIKTLIAVYQKTFRVPSITVAIVQNQETFLLDGFGKRNDTDAATTESLYPIGSCAKSFTAALAAKLHADKVISLDDPVQKHLNTFHLSDPVADRTVTLRDLLSHRTGLNGHDLLWYRAPWSLDESISRLEKLPLSGPFRQSFFYSSLTVAAAGKAIEKATKDSWESLVRKQLCEPAGITEIAFQTKQFHSHNNRAKGYRLLPDGKVTAMDEYECREPNPAGSIFLSAKSLDRWLKFQLDPKNQFHGVTRQPMIAVPMVESVMVLHPTSSKVDYGMGWLIANDQGDRVLLHGGMIDGFRCQITLYPEKKLGIALLNNLHDSPVNIALTYAIADRLLNRTTKPDWARHFLDYQDRVQLAKKRYLEQLAKSKLNRKLSLDLSKYIGTYSNPAYGDGKITLVDNQLVWSWSAFQLKLTHWDGDAFQMTAYPFEDLFLLCDIDGGQVKSLTFAEQTFEKK